jgi:hypothetical protein
MPSLNVGIVHNTVDVDFTSISQALNTMLKVTHKHWDVILHPKHVDDATASPTVDVNYGVMLGQDDLSADWKARFGIIECWGMSEAGHGSGIKKGEADLRMMKKDNQQLTLKVGSNKTRAAVAGMVFEIRKAIAKRAEATASQKATPRTPPVLVGNASQPVSPRATQPEVMEDMHMHSLPDTPRANQPAAAPPENDAEVVVVTQPTPPPENDAEVVVVTQPTPPPENDAEMVVVAQPTLSQTPGAEIAATTSWGTSRAPTPEKKVEPEAATTKVDTLLNPEKSPEEKIARALEAYARKPKTMFTFAPKSRELNSTINRELATFLYEQIDAEPQNIGAILSKAYVEASFKTVVAEHSSNPDFVNRGINSQDLNAILEAGRKRFPAPQPTFEEKKAQIEQAFQTYLDRVKADPSNGFVFFKASRTESRVVNIALVEKMMQNMKTASAADFAGIFTQDQVEKFRQSGFTANFNDRGMNSPEVHAALKLARKLFPLEPATPAPAAVTPSMTA